MTVSVRSMRFHRAGLIDAVYQSLHTSAHDRKSSADKNLNTGTSPAHRYRGSFSRSSESSLGTGLITYLGAWPRFFELDNISSMGTSALLAIGSLVRISSSIFTLPDVGSSGVAATFVSGMYSDYTAKKNYRLTRHRSTHASINTDIWDVRERITTIESLLYSLCGWATVFPAGR